MTSERKVRYIKLHMVLCPLPFQGHITPMLQLGSLLLHHADHHHHHHHQEEQVRVRVGSAVTVLHTRFNAPDPAKAPEGLRLMCVEELPIDGGPSHTEDIMSFTIALNAAVRSPYRDRLKKLLVSEQGEDPPPVWCVICDTALFGLRDVVVEELSLPLIALRTSGSACFNIYSAFPSLWEKGYYSCSASSPSLSQQDEQSNAPVPELPPFRVRDLPRFEMCNPDSVYQVLTLSMEMARAAKALIINTFEALEPNDLAKLQEDLQLPLFPVGPLHKFSPDIQSSLLTQDRTCLDWLDQMPPDSVLYVSFGSLACVTKEELLETAWGLANSCQPFVLVFRPGSVKGCADEAVRLPEDFLEEIKGRGRVVEWAPQQEVLSHPSVGGFWTHCGWNSVLESVCEGVPMLCWPYFGDQLVNTRVLDYVWKVGIPLDKVLERVGIERAVRRLMVEEEGREMRKRARALKIEADLCTRQGGSSYVYLDKLVEFISSLK